MISKRTVVQAADVILGYVPKTDAVSMLKELANVPGNSSFVYSVRALLDEIQNRSQQRRENL